MAVSPLFQGNARITVGELTSTTSVSAAVVPYELGASRIIKSIWVEYKGTISIELQRFGWEFVRRDVVGVGSLELVGSLLNPAIFENSAAAAGVPWDEEPLSLNIVGAGAGDYLNYRCVYREM